MTMLEVAGLEYFITLNLSIEVISVGVFFYFLHDGFVGVVAKE